MGDTEGGAERGDDGVNVTLVKSRAGTFIAYTDEDREKLRSIKPGQAVRVKIGRPRNLDHHRKLMALIQFVAEHHPDWRRHHSIEPLLYALKMATGHFTAYTRSSTGEIIQIPKSIAFDAVDEGDFVVWANKVRQIIFDELLPGFTERDKQRLAREIDGWMAWT